MNDWGCLITKAGKSVPGHEKECALHIKRTEFYVRHDECNRAYQTYCGKQNVTLPEANCFENKIKISSSHN